MLQRRAKGGMCQRPGLSHFDVIAGFHYPAPGPSNIPQGRLHRGKREMQWNRPISPGGVPSQVWRSCSGILRCHRRGVVEGRIPSTQHFQMPGKGRPARWYFEIWSFVWRSCASVMPVASNPPPSNVLRVPCSMVVSEGVGLLFW